jgi:hypothetical protein
MLALMSLRELSRFVLYGSISKKLTEELMQEPSSSTPPGLLHPQNALEVCRNRFALMFLGLRSIISLLCMP